MALNQGPINRVLQSDVGDQLKSYGNKLKSKAEAHKNFLKYLKWFSHHEEFYTLINLKTRKITWSHGIRTWLGYPEGDTRPQKMDYLNQYVHPFVRDWYRVYQNAALLVMTDFTIPRPKLEFRFVVTIPIKTEDNKYLIVKQMTMPYEYDNNNKVVTLIQSYTLVSEFRPLPLKLEFFQGAKKLEGPWEECFHNYVAKCVRIFKSRMPAAHLQNTFMVFCDFYDKGLEIKDTSLVKVLKGGKGQLLARSTVNKYMSELKNWLIGLMIKTENKKEILSFFPPQVTPAEVFSFYAKSGIIPFLVKYVNN